MLCGRCSAPVPVTEAFCQECGTAVAIGKEGGDSAVYPELARANLLRMRGDYKAAEDQCLGVLRRYPSNATANILLGDICSEKGDLEQAISWYEIALDLDRENPAARHKLERAQKTLKERETQAAVEQLTVNPGNSKAGLLTVALIFLLFAVAVGAYFIGQSVRQSRLEKAGRVITEPVRATGSAQGSTNPEAAGGAAAQNRVAEDDSLLRAIQESSEEGSRLIGAMQDPRSRVLTLTYVVFEGDSPEAVGAELARDTFAKHPDALVITLRATRRGSLAYVADALRSRYEETLTAQWKASNPDPNRWIEHLLTNEWPPPDATSHQADSGQAPEPPPVVADPSPSAESPAPAGTGGEESPPQESGGGAGASPEGGEAAPPGEGAG